MRIQTVSYRRLRNLGNFENDAVEATAAVERGETPEQALAKLADWVHERLGMSPDAIRLMEDRGRRLKDEIARLETNLEIARGAWVQARAVLAEQGTDADALVSQIPF